MEMDCVKHSGCMINVDIWKKKLIDNIVLDAFIICQKLRHVITMT